MVGKGSNEFAPDAIPMAEVAVTVGSHEVAEFWVRRLTITTVEDWRGARSLRAGDARRLVDTVRADRARADAQREKHEQQLADHAVEAERNREAEQRDVESRRCGNCNFRTRVPRNWTWYSCPGCGMRVERRETAGATNE